MNIQIKIQKFYPDLKLPEKKTTGAAAMDIAAYCPKANIILPVGETVLIPNGFCLEIPYGYFVEIRPRSGFSYKENIIIQNSPGTIDSDYRGEVKIILMNFGKENFKISRGDRIAQLIVSKVYIAKMVEEKELNPSSRG